MLSALHCLGVGPRRHGDDLARHVYREGNSEAYVLAGGGATALRVCRGFSVLSFCGSHVQSSGRGGVVGVIQSASPARGSACSDELSLQRRLFATAGSFALPLANTTNAACVACGAHLSACVPAEFGGVRGGAARRPSKAPLPFRNNCLTLAVFTSERGDCTGGGDLSGGPAAHMGAEQMHGSLFG